MGRFLESITFNNIIQGTLAIVALGGTFLLIINNREIPDPISLLDGAIIAFYFSNTLITNTVKKATELNTLQNNK